MLYIDDENERIVIGQFKYLQRSERHPRVTELTLLLNVDNELHDPQELRDAGRKDLADAAQDYIDARERGYVVQLHFVYPGRQSDDLGRLARSFNHKHLRESLNVSIIRLEDLELIYEDYVGAAGRVNSGSLDLESDSYYEETGSYGRSLVATIPGLALKNLYTEHGNRLFDQNVRLFLGTRKGSVNAGIRDTLNDASERSNFWAYNNGITIVARSFEVDPDEDVVTMRDFSIVNGCQTTVSISEASDVAAKKASVLGRVVAANPDLVDSIIRYTNSQTPIKLWDISVRDKLQQRLKRELGELEKPWFYALRRGEQPEKGRFGTRGARRVLPFPLSAQFLASLRGLPVEAYKDKARLFTTHKDKVLPNDTQASDLLWAWSVGQASERAIHQYRESLGVDETGAAILRRGARFFVTAVAGHLLRLRNGEDVFAKVDAQRVLDKALRKRLDNYALIAVTYYVRIMSDLIDSGSDLATLLRSAETTVLIERRVKERMFEDQLAPDALNEKLPLLPGISK